MSDPSRCRVSYDAALVEEAVLRAEGLLDASQRAAFRFERDRLYEVRDAEERGARFEELHGRWFLFLGLDRPLHQALSERPVLLQETGVCRVLRASSITEELADLFGPPVADGPSTPTLVVRLCPESLLDGPLLLQRLRHELGHVADMLDPEFGYERELPSSGGDPAADGLLRQRYHAAWDATIDGRLCRRGLLPATAREACRRMFARAFAALGAGAPEVFQRFFDDPRPTHAAIMAVAAPRQASHPSQC